MNPNLEILPRFLSTGEDWNGLVDRVSSVGDSENRQEYREVVARGIFTPAGQILRGAGRDKQVLYNCFVAAAEADEPPQQLAKRITEWTRRGAGVGVNLDSSARAARVAGGSVIDVVEAIASSQHELWMRGARRTATMVTLSFDDPEVVRVAPLLCSAPKYRHLNAGILVEDRHMRMMDDCDHPNGKVLKCLAQQAWLSGNPGFIFIDRVRRDHPFSDKVDACNPCAEQFLAPNEGCNLGSLNLATFVSAGTIDWQAFDQVVAISVRYLDDVVTASDFPSGEAKALAAARRRIGLGVLGLATALGHLGIPYGSPESVTLSEEWAQRLRSAAERASNDLGLRRGTPMDSRGGNRNSHLLSIAPTGAISLLWRASSGIEPYFGMAIEKESLAVDFPEVFRDTPRVATDISMHGHVAIAAAWQKAVDGGISKTVNLPASATIDDVLACLRLSWEMGCKGLSVFRSGSRPGGIATPEVATS